MTLNQFIQPWLDIYTQGGVIVIPLAVLSIAGFAVFLQTSLNYLSRVLTRRSSIQTKVPKPFISKKNYYQIFISSCLKAKHPSGHFLSKTQDELNKLRGDLWVLELIIQLAPILGILGTIIGVMQSIQGVDLSQEQGMKLVSRGFAKALITSIYGLSLACIFQLIYSSLQSNIQNIQNQFTQIYYEIVEWEANQDDSLYVHNKNNKSN